jgi:DNA-nicking Smr family endonuclease
MKRLRAEDAELWRRVTRNIAPLHRRPPLRPSRPPERELRASPAAEPPPAPPSRAAPRPAALAAASLDRVAGLDRATADRLKRGRYPVEARLDLHGMTQAEAHSALAGFLTRSRAVGRRCVLVITGHGRISGGVLKAAVPRWLTEPVLRPHLLGIAIARPQDGGTGALYVLLRRLPLGNQISGSRPASGSR